jgi:chemotaxis response regulator CheB
MGGIRVIVAESRDGSTGPVGLLRAVLEQEGVEVAGEVFGRSELIQLAADEQPDAVVFAARAPQDELDRLRAVAPGTKVVFVSPILTAAEAEMAEAVVERSDVLASLGPVLVHLCAPGRVNARRAVTEHFDRPDWIDRVRKDPATLRDILSDGSPRQPGEENEESEAPSVTSLQGEARAAEIPAAPRRGWRWPWTWPRF